MSLEDSVLRRRGQHSNHVASASTTFSSPLLAHSGQQRGFSAQTAFFLTLAIISAYVLIWQIDNRVPQPLYMKDEPQNPDSFISERALGHLLRLTSFGPRPAGSHANEVLAVNFLKHELNIIKQTKGVHHSVEVDLQRPTGSLHLNFIDGMTTHYAGVANLVAKLSPATGDAEHSLLINCHFDSVPGSPGASDDGVSCAIMLEVLQVLSRLDRPLKHNIIFLFNGAEENVLQASHGFITQHPWAKKIRAFVNLEACGAGGRELVFQAGPKNGWLVQAYASVAPHPFASVFGQEIFQSGLVPSDTDFRIFRDFGHIPGLDIAYVRNGYVYHTKYDDPTRIPLGSIQRAGDNLLALSHHLADSDKVGVPDSSDDMVFYDFVGLFMVIYSAFWGKVFNIVAVLLGAISTLVGAMEIRRQTGISSMGLILLLLGAGLVVVTSWVASLLGSLGIAAVLTVCSRNMSWFSRPTFLFALFVLPSLSVSAATFLYASRSFIEKRLSVGNRRRNAPSQSEELYIIAVNVILSVLCLFCTCKGLQSAFVLSVWVGFSSAGRLFLQRFYGIGHKGLNWLIVSIISVSFPTFVTLYMAWNMLVIFVPITGRIGALHNPDVIIAGLVWSMLLLIQSYMTPLVVLLEKPRKVFAWTAAAVGISLALIVLTPLGFPYSGDERSPTPQRILIHHVHRTFHDTATVHEDSGFWIVNVDYNSPKQYMNYLEDMNVHPVVEECDQALYCGFPHYYPAFSLLKSTHWIKGPKPVIHHPVTLKLVSQKAVQLRRRRFSFSVTGPDHMGIYLSTWGNASVVAWSLTESIPNSKTVLNGNPVYFIYYGRGLVENEAPWDIWIDIEVPDDYDGLAPTIRIAVTGHWFHGDYLSPDFESFLSRLPDWTYSMPFVSSYSAWTF